MKATRRLTRDSDPTWSTASRWAAGVAALTLIALLALAGSARAATSVGLGTADSFAVLAGSGVTNTGPTVVNGDLGTHPTPTVTGFGGAPNGTVNGTIHQADAVARQAQADLTTAYNDAAGQGPANTVATELGGQTLTPGVYNSSTGTFGITGTVTLNAQGNPDAVFIFQAASTLITASDSQVNLINGAQACNVFWQVGSSATLDTRTDFAGNILAQQSISVNDAVTVDGRLLARNGAVTLINDTITRAECAADGPDGPAPGPDGPAPGPDAPGPDAPGPDAPGPDGPGPDGPGDGPGPDGPGDGPGDAPGNGPAVHIKQLPKGKSGCISRGFRAKVRVRGTSKLKRASVFLDGNLIKRTTSKRFSVWIKGSGLRSGRHTIRVVAVDTAGRRDVDRRKFRRCAQAAPSPQFTG